MRTVGSPTPRRAARTPSRPRLFRVDDGVGDEPVAAEDQVQRTLALPDAALAQDGYSHAQDFHQDPVNRGGLGEHPVEGPPSLVEEIRRGASRDEAGEPPAPR